MSASIQQFIDAVNDSMLLVPAQKREFLDQPEMLPEAYRNTVIELLRAYDERSTARNENVERLTRDVHSKYAST